MELTQDSLPFITGMGYRKICDYIYDEFYQFDINNIDQFDKMKIFVKTDFLFDFEFKILPKINKNFILYTHNSDLCIDNKYLSILNNDYLIKWYGQNINTIHDKLQSIPIGIANRRWSHGDVEILKKIDPLTVIITNNLEPIYGVVFSIILFGESEMMSSGFYAGASVLLFAVFTYPFFKRKFH